jgi:hypothetical protein
MVTPYPAVGRTRARNIEEQSLLASAGTPDVPLQLPPQPSGLNIEERPHFPQVLQRGEEPLETPDKDVTAPMMPLMGAHQAFAPGSFTLMPFDWQPTLEEEAKSEWNPYGSFGRLGSGEGDNWDIAEAALTAPDVLPGMIGTATKLGLGAAGAGLAKGLPYIEPLMRHSTEILNGLQNVGTAIPDTLAATAGSLTAPWKKKLANSVVKKADGTPSRVYHGAQVIFEEFDARFFRSGLYGPGAYFSENPNMGLTYTKKGMPRGIPKAEYDPNVSAWYLDLKNVLDIDSEVIDPKVRKSFFDGMLKSRSGISDMGSSYGGVDESYSFYHPRLDPGGMMAHMKRTQFLEGLKRNISNDDFTSWYLSKPEWRKAWQQQQNLLKEIDSLLDNELMSFNNSWIRQPDVKGLKELDLKIESLFNRSFEIPVLKSDPDLLYRGSNYKPMPQTNDDLWNGMKTIIPAYYDNRGEMVNHFLVDLGYDGITHMGGGRVGGGGTMHRVWIALPKVRKDLNIDEYLREFSGVLGNEEIMLLRKEAEAMGGNWSERIPVAPYIDASSLVPFTKAEKEPLKGLPTWKNIPGSLYPDMIERFTKEQLEHLTPTSLMAQLRNFVP